MENADLNPMPMFNSSSTEQTRPDEIYIRSDHPDANDFIMVGGRCYKKTADESESYEITSENIFAGLLEKKDTLVVNPVEKPESATETRQDLAFSKFEDCPDCVDVGVRFRGQQKKNYRDFIIKVVKEPVVDFSVDTLSICETPNRPFEFYNTTAGGTASASWLFGSS